MSTNIHLSNKVQKVDLVSSSGSLAVTNSVLDDLTVTSGKLEVVDAGVSTIAGAVSSSKMAVSNAKLDSLVFSGDNLLVQGSFNPNQVQSHGNAWSASSVSASNNSTSVDLQYVSNCMALVSSSGTSSFKVQVSVDNTNFVDSGDSLSLNGASSGCINFKCGARYARLTCLSGVGVTVTASLCGKQ